MDQLVDIDFIFSALMFEGAAVFEAHSKDTQQLFETIDLRDLLHGLGWLDLWHFKLNGAKLRRRVLDRIIFVLDLVLFKYAGCIIDELSLIYGLFE